MLDTQADLPIELTRLEGTILLESRTISLAINRPWREIYEACWRPEAFARWASGLAQGSLRQQGENWVADGPSGPIRIRFTDRNVFGVMDHTVQPAGRPDVHVPMRIVANGAGAEVLMTLFRQPGMSEADFQADLEWVERDLQALRMLMEG